MKKKICSFITRFGGTMAALVLVVATMTANSTCAWLAYQPEEPEEVKMLKNEGIVFHLMYTPLFEYNRHFV